MSRSGLIDMFTSRRDHFDSCYFWKRDETISNKLDYDFMEPSGRFDAKQIEAIEQMPQIIAGMFMFDSTTTTIKSNDDLSELDNNDIVKFRGKFYRVESVQGLFMRKNNEFTDDVPMVYYMRLKR